MPKIAVSLGIAQKKFEECLASGKYANKVKADYQDGVTAGVNGTPANFLLLKKPLSEKNREKIAALYAPFRDENGELPISFSKDGKIIGLLGAMPLLYMTGTIDLALEDQK